MESRRWARVWALSALVVLVAACSGIELRRPMIAYDFDNPILNERWLRAHHDPLPPARAKSPVAKNAEGPSKLAEHSRETPPTVAPASQPAEGPSKLAERSRAAAVSPRGTGAKPLPIVAAAEQVQLERKESWEDAPGSPAVAVALPSIPGSAIPAAGRHLRPKGLGPGSDSADTSTPAPAPASTATAPEIADAAGRLVGIRSSFDQDSFLKHVLFVSNVTLDDAPAEGLLGWVWKRYGQGGGRSLKPGHLVFLGWGGRARIAGVVESVDEHGTAQFITINGDEVKRLTLTPGNPRARRDERSGRILNSAVGKGRLAGETLMGAVRVVPDDTGSSGLATAD